ncbi:MAG: DUF4337 domain-containing protein [Gemmataceae bacterium]|nr:DUF4337 domain-containing protein [Gemmataceae bacterium]
MTHGHVHEEAEHASHHAGDPFDKVVALTMVVIAALLAGVKVLAHRTHNDTLAYQIKAGVEKGEANDANTKASSLWNLFQSKKAREMFSEQDAKLLVLLSKKGDAIPTRPLPNRDKRKASLLKDLNDERVEDAEKVADKILDNLMARYQEILAAGYEAGSHLPMLDAEMKAARYREEGKAIAKRAREGEKVSEKHTAKAENYRKMSNAYHGQANWFDAGELGVELAIVLCSVAILAKDKKFWYGGMIVAALGAVIVAIGWFM